MEKDNGEISRFKMIVAQTFQLTLQEIQDYQNIRRSYRRLMIQASRKRSKRIKLNKAYQIAINLKFNTKDHIAITLIMEGRLNQLQVLLVNDRTLLNEKIGDYPLIYYAVRSGHYDIVQFFLKIGCDLKFQGQKSTPMHCAAYYGHYTLIPLLLQYSIPVDILNYYENLPEEEAATDQIKKLLKNAKKNRIQSLQQKLLQEKIAYTAINIYEDKEVCFKKIILENYFKTFNDHVDAFHGTSFEALYSIAKNGLRKPGQIVNGKSLDIVPGHIPLGKDFQGKKDWSRAIFVSPSIYYAAHPVYSKQVIINGKETWLPLVQVKVKKGHFERFDHTLKFYDQKVNQTVDVQWRVECKDLIQNLIMRTEVSQSVTVIAILFVKKGYLDSHDDYLEVTKNVLKSEQERMFIDYGKNK